MRLSFVFDYVCFFVCLPFSWSSFCFSWRCSAAESSSKQSPPNAFSFSSCFFVSSSSSSRAVDSFCWISEARRAAAKLLSLCLSSACSWKTFALAAAAVNHFIVVLCAVFTASAPSPVPRTFVPSPAPAAARVCVVPSSPSPS